MYLVGKRRMRYTGAVGIARTIRGSRMVGASLSQVDGVPPTEIPSALRD